MLFVFCSFLLVVICKNPRIYNDLYVLSTFHGSFVRARLPGALRPVRLSLPAKTSLETSLRAWESDCCLRGGEAHPSRFVAVFVLALVSWCFFK